MTNICIFVGNMRIQMIWYRLLAGCILLFMASLVKAQDPTIQRFMAVATGTDVLLTWEVKLPVSGTTEYRIFRKINQEQNFTQLATQSYQNGKALYEFWDRTIFKDTPKWIQYRLMVVRANGSTATLDTYITVNPTSAQRTWGSIKSMFK